MADAERYVAEAEKLLLAEKALCEQKWPEDELPTVMKEIKEVVEADGPSDEEVAAVRELLDSVRELIESLDNKT